MWLDFLCDGGWGRKREKWCQSQFVPPGGFDGCHHRVGWLREGNSGVIRSQDWMEGKFLFWITSCPRGRGCWMREESHSLANSGQLWTPLVCAAKDYTYRRRWASAGDQLLYFMCLGGETYLPSNAEIDPSLLAKMTVFTLSWLPFWQLLIVMWGRTRTSSASLLQSCGLIVLKWKPVFDTTGLSALRETKTKAWVSAMDHHRPQNLYLLLWADRRVAGSACISWRPLSICNIVRQTCSRIKNAHEYCFKFHHAFETFFSASSHKRMLCLRHRSALITLTENWRNLKLPGMFECFKPWGKLYRFQAEHQIIADGVNWSEVSCWNDCAEPRIELTDPRISASVKESMSWNGVFAAGAPELRWWCWNLKWMASCEKPGVKGTASMFACFIARKDHKLMDVSLGSLIWI